MKNRENIQSMNLYDFLRIVQHRAEKRDICIMDLLPRGRRLCPFDNPNCDECLRRWLNEEEK